MQTVISHLLSWLDQINHQLHVLLAEHSGAWQLNVNDPGDAVVVLSVGGDFCVARPNRWSAPSGPPRRTCSRS